MIRLLTQDERPSWLARQYGHRNKLPNRMYKFCQGNKIIAIAGFRMCEGRVCLFEGLATSPSESPELRQKAIRALVEYVSNAALELGFNFMFAMTSEATVLKRADELGWVTVPQTIIAKAL